jgi:hypothetical protein
LMVLDPDEPDVVWQPLLKRGKLGARIEGLSDFKWPSAPYAGVKSLPFNKLHYIKVLSEFCAKIKY